MNRNVSESAGDLENEYSCTVPWKRNVTFQPCRPFFLAIMNVCNLAPI